MVWKIAHHVEPNHFVPHSTSDSPICWCDIKNKMLYQTKLKRSLLLRIVVSVNFHKASIKKK